MRMIKKTPHSARSRGIYPTVFFPRNAVLVTTLLCAASARATPTYIVTLLGNIGADATGNTTSKAYFVNALGDTVGAADKYVGGIALGSRGVRWTAGQTAATELGNLGTDANGTTSSYAYAINTRGDAGGYSYRYTNNTYQGVRAVRWLAGGSVATELANLGPNPSGLPSATVYALNASGDAAGLSTKYTNGVYMGDHAVRWMAGQTGVSELGDLGKSATGIFSSKVNAIDAAGDAGGTANKYVANVQLGNRAVRWMAGQTAAIELGSLGTTTAGVTFSGVDAGNALGDLGGYATKYSGNSDLGFRAVRWAAGQTTATELGNLGTDASGITSSAVYAIDDSGYAVGVANKYSGNTNLGFHAVLWPAGQTTAVDLNDLIDSGSGWVLVRAQAINGFGTIVGSGQFDPDGAGPAPAQTRAFRLDPLPEPSVVAPLGLMGIALGRRRRRPLSARVVAGGAERAMVVA
jgi:hypothetical protein